jgi:hypothetical protein
LRWKKWREAGDDCIMRSFRTCSFKRNIVKVIKSRMIWVGHVACVEEMRSVYKILVGKSKGKRQDIGINGNIFEIMEQGGKV